MQSITSSVDLSTTRSGIPMQMPANDPFTALSQRELDVVQQLVDGNSTERGSQELYISCNTFRSHLKNISRKIDAHSSLEIVSRAVSAGMRPRSSVS